MVTNVFVVDLEIFLCILFGLSVDLAVAMKGEVCNKIEKLYKQSYDSIIIAINLCPNIFNVTDKHCNQCRIATLFENVVF